MSDEMALLLCALCVNIAAFSFGYATKVYLVMQGII